MGEDMTGACPHFHFVRKGFIAAVCKEKSNSSARTIRKAELLREKFRIRTRFFHKMMQEYMRLEFPYFYLIAPKVSAIRYGR